MDRKTRYMVIAMRAAAGVKIRHEGPKFIRIENAINERNDYASKGWLACIKTVQVAS